MQGDQYPRVVSDLLKLWHLQYVMLAHHEYSCDLTPFILLPLSLILFKRPRICQWIRNEGISEVTSQVWCKCVPSKHSFILQIELKLKADTCFGYLGTYHQA
jgi:hypothetical protein